MQWNKHKRKMLSCSDDDFHHINIYNIHNHCANNH